LSEILVRLREGFHFFLPLLLDFKKYFAVSSAAFALPGPPPLAWVKYRLVGVAFADLLLSHWIGICDAVPPSFFFSDSSFSILG